MNFIIVGVILLVWFLLPFFSYRILNIGNLTGIGVSLVLLLYGIFFRPVNRFVAWFWQMGVGKVIEVVLGSCILAILVLAVMCMVCMGKGMSSGFQQDPNIAEAAVKPPDKMADVQGQREKNDTAYLPQNDVSGINAKQDDAEVSIDQSAGTIGESLNNPESMSWTIIVLGCKTIGDRPSLMLTERLQAAYDYLSKHPDATAIVSGGLGEDETVAEAEVMYRWLVEENGISPERILQEDRSTDTHENLANCYEIILQEQTQRQISTNSEEEIFPDRANDYSCQEEQGTSDQEKIEYTWSQNVLLATNEFHEYRALKIAREIGFNAKPLPAKTAWWLFPTYYVREMYGILEDWFLV